MTGDDRFDPARDHKRRSNLRFKFGLTVERYERMLDKQGGVCAICFGHCFTGRRLAVDHDHKSGRIRGLLCNRCNRCLGRFDDDPNLLYAAAMYLAEASE